MISAFLSNRVGNRTGAMLELKFNQDNIANVYDVYDTGNEPVHCWKNDITYSTDRFGTANRAVYLNGNANIGVEKKYINKIVENNFTIHASVCRERLTDYEKLIDAPETNYSSSKFIIFLHSYATNFVIGNTWCEFSYVVPVGEYKLLSFTYDGVLAKLYVDGLFHSQVSCSEASLECAAITIGSSLLGKIDFFQLKNVTDTAEQVKNMYNEIQYNRLL